MVGPATLDGGLGLEAANIVKTRRHRIGFLKIQAEQIGRLQAQEDQGQSANQHKQANPDITFLLLHDFYL